MDQALSREYHFGSLLRYALPTIVMMVFMSLYTIVDGAFVSRFVGAAALSAINIIYPVQALLMALAVMLATGGNAVIARRLGEGREDLARQNFSLITLTGVILCCVVSGLCLAFLEPLCLALGANDVLLPPSMDYLGTLLWFTPATTLQMLFQVFFVTAGYPGLGLGLTLASGISNAVLDYLLIVPAGLGIRGAAFATAAGQTLTAVVGLWFFAKHRGRSTLWFTAPRWDGRALFQSCTNGSSEMVTNLANAVITLLFNQAMMGLLGEDGVAAITIVLYGQYILSSMYLGFSMGVSPILSYNYGSGNWPRLRYLLGICLKFVAVSSLAFFAVFMLCSPLLVAVFTPPPHPVYDLALHGFRLFGFCCLFAGTNIFASAHFTALSDGRTSAFISFLRTFGMILPVLVFMPRFIGVDGVWLAVPVAEFLTLLFAAGLLLHWNRHAPRETSAVSGLDAAAIADALANESIDCYLQRTERPPGPDPGGRSAFMKGEVNASCMRQTAPARSAPGRRSAGTRPR